MIEGSCGISQITSLRGNVIEGSRGGSQITSLARECGRGVTCIAAEPLKLVDRAVLNHKKEGKP